MQEHHVELEGKNYVCQKRVRTIQEEPGDVPYDQSEYSFDRGQTWHTTMISAYNTAKSASALMQVASADGQAGDYEAFALGLLQEVQDLGVGESLRITRDQAQIVVVKEQAVLATRASTIQEVDLRIGQGADSVG